MKNLPYLLAVLLTLSISGWPDLIVNQVPRSLLAAPSNTDRRTDLPASEFQPTQKRPASAGERWEKFEAEFGITEQETSPLKSSLQTAKYQLDHTTFAVQEFVHHVESLLRFDFVMRDLGTSPTKKAAPRGSSGSVLLDTFNETRFKSNIDLRLSNRQFVGVKLIIPLGD